MREQIQLERRRQRALEEGFKIGNIGGEPYFSTFSVLSPSGRTYLVTTRSLKRSVNSCTCPDFQTNLLGTCKHIEAVLAMLGKKLRGRIDEAERSAPPTAEVFLRYGEQVEVAFHSPTKLRGSAGELLRRYFDDQGSLAVEAARQVPALIDEISRLKADQAARLLVKPGILTPDDSARIPWLQGLLAGQDASGAAPLESELVERMAAAVERLRDAASVCLTARSL